MKKITDILIWSGSFIVLFALLGFANVMHDKKVCENVVIKVDNTYENHFVNTEDIQILIHNKNGAIKGRELKMIDTQSIEEQVQNNPFVKNTEVYKTIGGNVNIKVVQRKPIVRILTSDNNSFYIDENKTIMPLSNKFTSRILIVNGAITNKQVKLSINKNSKVIKKTLLASVYEIAKYIDNSEFFKAQIEQIYFNENNEFELIPKVGRHVILFGSTKNLQTKFEKLELFYKKGVPQVGWDKYKLVNLKYDNQVVCTKK